MLYRTLGPTLPDGAAAAAALWALAHRCALVNPDRRARAGFGEGAEAGERLFDAILASPSGVVFTDDDWDETWARLKTPDGVVHLEIPELLDELAALADEAPPGDDPQLAVLAVRRRATLVHRQHHPPRPGVAQARRRGRAARQHRPTRRRSDWSTAARRG